MITKNDALNVNTFHHGRCIRTIGKRGGVTVRVENWRRNGVTQTWKTRPDEFRVPIKYGMRDYGAIENYNAAEFHTSESCPLNES